MGATSNLVLGGSGLIGQELQKQLKELGEQVINLDLKAGTDLREFSLEEYAGVDFIWFLAWDSGGAKYIGNQKNFVDIYRNNTRLCNNIFSFIEKHNKAFLFTSSQLAASDTPYGLTKLYAEKWGSLLGGKMARLWNVYGWEEPDERSHVIPDLIIQGLTNKKITLMTSGEERRQFIYVKDCVKNLLSIRKKEGNHFSLTNGHWLKIKDLASVIASELSIPLVVGKEKGYENIIEPDPGHKNFTFNYSLEQGIKEIMKSAVSFINQSAVSAKHL